MASNPAPNSLAKSLMPVARCCTPDRNWANVHASGPVREIELAGRKGLNTLSVRTHLALRNSCHTINQQRGSLTLWFLPLEDIAYATQYGPFRDLEPDYGVLPLLSDHLPLRNLNDAHFFISWNLYWWRQLLFRFNKHGDERGYRTCSGQNAAFGPCEIHVERENWYQLGLSWNHANQEYYLYLNGIRLTTGHKWTPQIVDRCGDTLFTGCPLFAMGELAFYDQTLSHQQFKDLFAAEATQINPKVQAALQSVHEPASLPDWKWSPDCSWKCELEIPFNKPSDLDHFYIQGCKQAVQVTPEGLLIETPRADDPPYLPPWTAGVPGEFQVYLHTLKSFEGDVAVEFDFMTLKEQGLALLMIQSSGMQREDHMADYPLRTSGHMTMVFGENVRNYHWEFYREMDGVRSDVATHAFFKNPRLFGRAYQAMPAPLTRHEWHRVRLVQEGRRFRGAIDDVCVFDVTDNPFDNSGAVYNSGHVTLRNMFKSKCLWKNLRVHVRPPAYRVSPAAGMEFLPQMGKLMVVRRWILNATLGSIMAVLFMLPGCSQTSMPAVAEGSKKAIAPVDDRKLVLSCPSSNIEEFERVAALAKELGFTHVNVSHLPKARWVMKLDPTDPYPNWGMRYPAILHVAVPPQMREWVDAEHGRRCMEIIAQRGDVLRRLGLKGAFFSTDPMWLPEAAYVAHPNWRGPRAEHQGRAKRPYYAPCIDDPEMLAMYRTAVAEICRAAPVELFEMKVNDAGAGICWSEAIYMGANGPEACKHRTYAQRVVEFLSVMQQGAKDAGLTAQVEFNMRVIPKESEAIAGHLKPGQVVSCLDDRGKPARVAAGYATYMGRGTGKSATGPGPKAICATMGNYQYASHTFPVLDIPQPMLYAEQLERFVNRHADGLVYIPSADCHETFELIRQFNVKPFDGIESRQRAMQATAEACVGKAAAPMLVSAWAHIAKAVNDSYSQIQYGGPLFMLGTVSQRWLIRPLVPYPLELKPKEKDYYRRFQFQAQSEEKAADLLDTQGDYLISGTQGTRDAVRILERAIEELQTAQKDLRSAGPLAKDDAARTELNTLDLRLSALIYITQNAILTAQYQDFLNRCGPLAKVKQPTTKQADGLPAEAVQIIQADIENTTAMIALLKSSPVPLLITGPVASEEDVFTFGPDLLQQLQRKIEINRAHLEDHRRL